MSFYKYDKKGNKVRNRVTCDCQKAIEEGEEILVEQSKKNECDINEIIRKHGTDLIAQTSMMQSQNFQFDDVTGNDFQEAMIIITKAQQEFDTMPSKLRQQFNNNPAEFLDFVQNPDNQQALVEMGLANPPEPPPEAVQVVVQNPETTSETPPA